MVTPELLEAVRRLPRADQMTIVNTIAESLNNEPVEVPSDVQAILLEAIADADAHPENSVPWEVVRADLDQYRARIAAKL